MIVADTSVWIDYFKGKENPHTDKLDASLDGDDVLMGDLILLEILQGFRSDVDYKKAKSTLAVLDQAEMLGNSMVYKCASSYRALRKKGITIRRTNDVVIATFCIENKVPLLFQDRYFNPFVDKLGLKAALP